MAATLQMPNMLKTTLQVADIVQATHQKLHLNMSPCPVCDVFHTLVFCHNLEKYSDCEAHSSSQLRRRVIALFHVPCLYSMPPSDVAYCLCSWCIGVF
eukprot:1155851-Amphidinium_carterae.1